MKASDLTLLMRSLGWESEVVDVLVMDGHVQVLWLYLGNVGQI